jgi:hypothetical protein
MRFKSRVAAAAWAVLAYGAMSGAGTGCGQAFSSSTAGGSDASAEGTSSGSGPDGSSTKDGTTDSSSGGPDTGIEDGSPADADAAPICARPDGGRPSDPGFVDCGGTPCDLSTSVCCIQQKNTEAGSIPPKCVPACTSALNVVVNCDETADCQHGKVCCVDLVTGAQTCQTSCIATLQLCRCDQECPASAPCTVCPGYERCTTQCG